MKIKLDENLPDRLVSILTGLAHDVDTVRGEQLTGRADPDVWSAAQAAQRFLITQDLDFSDARRYTPGLNLASTDARACRRTEPLILISMSYGSLDGLEMPLGRLFPE